MVIAIGLATPAVRADPAESPPRLAILVGPAVRHAWLHDTSAISVSTEQTVPALAGTLALRVVPHLAFGIHIAAARATDGEASPGNHSSDQQSWSVLSIDLAIAAQLEIGPVALGPWLGRRDTWVGADSTFCTIGTVGSPPPISCRTLHSSEWTSDFVSYGLTASVAIHPAIPVAVLLDLQTGTGGAPRGPAPLPLSDYSSITVGLAYRR